MAKYPQGTFLWKYKSSIISLKWFVEKTQEFVNFDVICRTHYLISRVCQNANQMHNLFRVYSDARCNALQHATTHCNALQNAIHRWSHGVSLCLVQHSATQCNTVLYGATHQKAQDEGWVSVCTLKHSATPCNTLQHSATRCNTLPHPTWCQTRVKWVFV